MTMIEGEIYFDIAKDKEMRAEMEKEREALEKLNLIKEAEQRNRKSRVKGAKPSRRCRRT